VILCSLRASVVAAHGFNMGCLSCVQVLVTGKIAMILSAVSGGVF